MHLSRAWPLCFRMNETRAWWQSAMAYADTALMKNLQPWIVRKFAVPVVAFYLFRLMAMHRNLARTASKRPLVPKLVPIVKEFDAKVDAMMLYASQFREFFASRDDCVKALQAYGHRTDSTFSYSERYWVAPTLKGPSFGTLDTSNSPILSKKFTCANGNGSFDSAYFWINHCKSTAYG